MDLESKVKKVRWGPPAELPAAPAGVPIPPAGRTDRRKRTRTRLGRRPHSSAGVGRGAVRPSRRPAAAGRAPSPRPKRDWGGGEGEGQGELPPKCPPAASPSGGTKHFSPN